MRNRGDWKLEKINRQNAKIAILEEELCLVNKRNGMVSGENTETLERMLSECDGYMKEVGSLKAQYVGLVSELKEMREKYIKMMYGNKVKYKFLKWFIK